MIRIGDRDFLFTWRRLRAATQPDPEATTWRVGVVRWCRYRYTHATPDHALTIEVHRLDHGAGKDGWSVMVVAEHWWDERHKLIRNNFWATHLSGSRFQVAEWFACQASMLDKSPSSALKRNEDESQHLEEFEE